MKANYEDDDDIVSGDFRKVPIDTSNTGGVEVYSLYSSTSYAKDRLKKKIIRYALIVIAIIIFAIITKKFLWEGIVQIFRDDNYDDTFGKNYNQTFDDGGLGFNQGELFFLSQNLSHINLDIFASPQLRNKKKINLINKLEISLSVEYDKFVHLKIKDADKDRWEVPEEDILNQDYLFALEDNKIPLSVYSSYLDSKNYYIEFLSNKYSDDRDFDHFRDIDVNDENPELTNEFAFRLMTNDEEQFYYFNTSEKFIFSDNYINFQSEITSENIYGFGERTHDFKLNEGLYTIWPKDPSGTKYDVGVGGGNQYSHQPIGLHKTKYKNLWLGFVFLNTNAQDVKINKINDTNYGLEHKTIGGIIDYYVIVDNSPEEVLKNIQFLLGIPTLPPFWSLGNHQSRYGYKNFEEFKNVYESYKKNEIPIDTMWIDIDAMEKYELFTVNENFSKLGPYVKDVIHKEGGKFVPIVDIGVSYENLNSTLLQLGKKLNIFIQSNYTKKPLIGQVWPGKTVFPDFMNPKSCEFWHFGLNKYQKLINFDGIWLDMNEPANLLKDSKCITEIADEKQCTKDKNIYDISNLPYIPGYNEKTGTILSQKSISENAIINENLTVYDTKPLISYFEGKTTFEYLNNSLTRPFILSRSTTLGSGKYVFHWLGDNFSSESDIKNSISGIFNFNIFGIPFTGADICGFFSDSEKNLCIRWYNLGSFYPFMRNHNDKRSKDQFPWSFADINPKANNTKDKATDNKYDIIKLIKDNVNIRYSLLRYMYSQLFLISINEKGSFFKPLMFEFPEEETSYEDIESKIMFGEAFLLCAFYDLSEKDKEFILPNITFNKYPSGKTVLNHGDKDTKIKLSGKLDEVHLFLREGYIIPKQNTFNKYILNTMKLREEKIDLIINVDCYNQSQGVIFYDNDEIDTISEKRFYRVDMNFTNNKLNIVTTKNNLLRYKNKDKFLGSVEIWNAGKVYENIGKDKNKKYRMEINFKKDAEKDKEIIEGKYDSENDKVVYEINEKKWDISIFDIEEVLFN